MSNADDQPDRIGSETNIFASSSAASTAFVPTGRNTAAQIVYVPPSFRRRPDSSA